MQYELSTWSNCATDLRTVWSQLDATGAPPESPFLAWEFFDSVDRVCHNVEVVTLRKHGQITACFPFQRSGRRRAVPVAAAINDFHGPIALQPEIVDFEALFRVAGLNRFDFHASPCIRWTSNAVSSHEVLAYRAELGGSCGEYVDHLLDDRYSIRQQRRKTRAIERRVGPLRFEWHSRDEKIFDQLLSWKSSQYNAMGVRDIFAQPWTRELLRQLLRVESDALQGQLSALYAGDELVAVHYGLRRGNVLHSWFPAYSAEHAKYSPGMEMFLQLASHSPGEGVNLLDFGYGAEPFKTKLANRCYAVQCGAVDLLPWRRTLSTWGRSARFQAKRLPWPKNMKRAVRRASLTLNQLATTNTHP